MSNYTDFFIGLALLAFCCVMGVQIYKIPSTTGVGLTPATFPLGVTAMLGLLALVLTFKGMCGKKRASLWPERAILVKVLMMLVLILGYVTAFIQGGELAYEAELPEGIGFCTSTFAFLCCAQVLTGYRSILKIFAFAACITALLYVIFALLFSVPLP